ncbi:sigma-54-dependent transcriptional regulator [Runella slithyformis]|uniref:Two component, sigma54 specific, transcriptional regulator, Fis family n=1 Tax=Runella slithyformis (strain ATCC 29530 / DSM 19594 / LMG 11500 / NCIMB 11436 / LSU 4) TaxID=761193 RepID=A0A7U3ZLI6_RUNSL|nr:sigma-54 dependent transcriptional regulator [Runella slithyformis]AEI49420.1 two component, sigma54 specific, transcriptional regulator, Fis family [Runella slithyformis DSM 19594]
MPNLLLIDDEIKLRGLLKRILELEGYHVSVADNAHSAFNILEKQDIQVVVCDVKLPDAHGVELTQRLKTQFPLIEVILLTAYGTIADGVKAVQNGAFDYLTKGDDNDRIVPLVARAVEKAELQQKVKRLEEKVSQKFGFRSIIGHSKPLQEAIALAQKVAVTDTTVLLLGETGTGKEVFAQAIHQESPRRDKPFVALNCSAFSREILESELFGHRTGAFTGALKDKKGLMEEAHGGTLFLDEIGEMSPDLQAKLLRVLETNTFYKVGDTKPTQVNVRFIAATNRDLQKEAEGLHFRLDLYYRLSVFEIKLPSLRQRPEDIPLLAAHFVQIYAAKMNRSVPKPSAAFLEKLQHSTWKGNIRELKNVIERAVILSNHSELTDQELPFEMQFGTAIPVQGVATLAEIEKQHIQRMLQHTQGNKTETARLLGIGLTTLYRKIEEYDL